jgi:deazaflavin-dependent oxidoreductase (nitroreductase family)
MDRQDVKSIALPDRPSRFQRGVQRLAAMPANSRWLPRLLHRLDLPFLRISGGRTSLTTLLTGLPTVVLTTTGRRSGQLRQTPLVGIPFEGVMILIASNFGRRAHPGWYYNLRADPHAQVSIKGKTYPCRARLASGAEREALYKIAAALYPGYLEYRQRAAWREIGVFVLEFEEGQMG